MRASHLALWIVLTTTGCGEATPLDTDDGTDTATDPPGHCEMEWPQRADHPRDASQRGFVGSWWVHRRTWVEDGETLERNYPVGELPNLVQTQDMTVEASKGTYWDVFTSCSGEYLVESNLPYTFAWQEVEPGSYTTDSEGGGSLSCEILADDPHALRCDKVDSNAPGTMELWRL